jgi:nucleoside-diphosphate-sugar epimerase
MDWKSKNVLVAGGAGMIGSHVARRLVKEGANVTVADDLSSGSKQNISDIEKEIIFYQYDLRDPNVCRAVCEGKFVVFVFCANMGGIGWLATIHADIARDNVLMNTNLLEACRVRQVPQVYISSSACCYNTDLQTSSWAMKLSERMAWPALPNEIYGLEKLFAEELALAYTQDYGMNIKIGRHHNVYDGCFTSFDRKKSKAPCALVLKAIEHPNPEFAIWGDGEQTRSFLYIDDCVEMILRLMQTDYNKPINIGTEQGVTINYLADLAIKASGKRIKPIYDLTKPQGVRGRNSDNTLFREVVGYDPKVTLEEGIPKVYEWAVKNYDKLEGI